MSLKEQVLIGFHGDQIQTVRTEKGIYVAMKSVVENMGLDWSSQSSRLKSNSKKFDYGDIAIVAGDGRLRNMGCIPIRKLNGWLFTVNPNNIKNNKTRKKVEEYQEECFHVLHGYWFGKKVSQEELKLPQNYREALKALLYEVEEKEKLQEKIEADKPLVEFAGKIQESNDAISIGEFSKILSKNGYMIGQNNLFKKLRELKLIFISNRKNIPYQSAVNSGWFKYDEFSKEVIKDETGEVINKLCTKITVTGKGQVYISNRLKNTDLVPYKINTTG